MNKQMIEKREKEIAEEKEHIAELQKELTEIQEFWKTHDEEKESKNVDVLYDEWCRVCGVSDCGWIKTLAVLQKASKETKEYKEYKAAYDLYKKMNKRRVPLIEKSIKLHKMDLAVYEARLAACK